MTKQMGSMSAGSKAAAAKQLAGGGMFSGLPQMPGMGGRGSTKAPARGVKKRKPKRR
jgi:hypothetical protein